MPDELRARYRRMTAYDRRLLPNPRLAEMEQDATQPADWYEGSGYSIGYPAWGLLYYTVLCRVFGTKEALILETGTNVGASTIVLAQALHDGAESGVVRTVDINADHVEVARQNIELAGHRECVEFFVGDAIEHFPAMTAWSEPVSVAFLDGCHVADHVEREFAALHPHLADDAIVVIDNTRPRVGEEEHPQVNTALSRITREFGGSLVCLPNCSWGPPGVSIWQRHPFPGVASWPGSPSWAG